MPTMRAHREFRDLAVWCQDNNLSLNMSKTKEMIVDYTNKPPLLTLKQL